jgi:rSAM/selenodomain-associated transferase 2
VNSKPHSPTISVIIPTLNEAKVLERTLAHLHQTPGLEIIVVDGGSTDGTVALAKRHAIVLTAPPGRAAQMNRGAQQATGEVLLFLHADTLIGLAALRKMAEALEDPTVVGGAFRLVIDSPRRSLRLIAAAANIRTRLTRIPYGDQGIFVRRSVFEKLGGFPIQPLMEDVEFARRLKRVGRVVLLPEPAVTSSRRWDKEGMGYTTLRNQVLLMLYFIGVSPDRLARWYRSVR